MNACWCCGLPSQEKHHIRPKRYGGSDEKDNIVPLCIVCHDIVDSRNQPSRKSLDRITDFPKIQTLITCRLWADLQHKLVIMSTERETIKLATEVLQNPTDSQLVVKLARAVGHLKNWKELALTVTTENTINHLNENGFTERIPCAALS